MASAAHLCLRWNNYQTNLTSVFDQLLQSETFVDVTLAADGHAIKAHRMVLSACSPYFQALFFDNPCQHPIVILKDTRWSELKAIVEYMYRGEISVAQEELTSLLRVAETLKIRGLSELNGDRQGGTAGGDERSESVSPSAAVSAAPNGTLARRLESPSSSWPLQTQPWSRDDTPTMSPRTVKRRRTSGTERSSASSPAGSVAPAQEDMSLEGPLPLVGHAHQSPASSSSNATSNAASSLNLPSLTIHQQHVQASPADDLDIKPGIAELIREEERARMLEGGHPWLSTPPSVLSGSGQPPTDPRDALWQKAWATGQGVMQNLRFRERGPFKTWRPETMAEAIMAVLREGLSLSQAARKFDIPYPTFVLYANRVNNMLGPSVEGGIELRPKGRGRPQRILTGSWPEDHVHGVIRAVVFRDPSSLPRHFERGVEREDLSRMPASKPSISRIITSGPNDCGVNITGSRLNAPASSSGEMAMSSSSSSLNFPPFNAMRSMAGPSSSSNGIEIIGPSNIMNPNHPMNTNPQMQSGSSSNSCLVNSGGGLTSSSLFSVLQQEVAEETRLAALNAMSQRLMPPMDTEAAVSMTIGGSSGSGNSLSQQQQQQLSCQQQQQQLGWYSGASFSNQIPMVDDVGAPDDVEQLASTYQGHSSSAGPVHVKQEQLFGD